MSPFNVMVDDNFGAADEDTRLEYGAFQPQRKRLKRAAGCDWAIVSLRDS